MKRGLLVAVSALVLGGCASAAKMENIPSEGSSNSSYPSELEQSISVGEVTGGKTTNPLLTSKVSSAAFSAALQRSLKTAGLLNDGGRFLLTAEILTASSPMVGVNMKATMSVEYTLTAKDSGEVVMQESITTTGAATPGEAFIAATRQRIAMERSAKSNIEKLLRTLPEMHLSPAGMGPTR